MKKLILVFAIFVASLESKAQYNWDTNGGPDSFTVFSYAPPLFNFVPELNVVPGQYVRIVAGSTLKIGNGNSTITPTSISDWNNKTSVDIGTEFFNGDGSTLQFVVTHGLSYTPNKVLLTPKSQYAINFYIDNITSTTFRVNYIVAPPIGSNNIEFDWFSFK